TMPYSNGSPQTQPQPQSQPASRPTTEKTSDAVTTMSLAQVLVALDLHHAASILDAVTGKAIARNDSPTSLVDHLMREELSVQIERRAQVALKRSAIFPLRTLDTYDFKFPKTIDRDLIMRAASLEFIAEKTNCVLVGPSGRGK